MSGRTRWKVVETTCRRDEAARRWEEARGRGAAGAVTSWGSGIGHRETLRVFWEEGHGDGGMRAVERAAAEDMVEQDWSKYWREALRPFPAGERVTLAPSWDKTTPAEGEVRIRIDPGMAFGAGDHPTTRMSVRILEDLSRSNESLGSILDVGAGTGVLAIAAALLGLGAVDALDIDPFCFASLRRNLKLNNAGRLVTPLLLSLDLLGGDKYGLVMANVVVRQIETLATMLAEKVEPGGTLLLSGFEHDALARVRQALGEAFSVERVTEEDGWVALLARQV